MLEKGIWSNREHVSSWLIDHKFKKLLKEVEAGYLHRPRSILFEFIQDCANRDLPQFLEACFNNPEIDKLSADSTMYEFWDQVLSLPSARKMVKTFHPKNPADQLRPQSSISSYCLIMGYYYLRRAAIVESRGNNADNLRHIAYLDKAIRYGNFRAFVIRTGHLLRELNIAFTEGQPIDNKILAELLPQLEDVANKYGAAGFLVLAKIYLFISRYQYLSLNNQAAYFRYYLAAYAQLVKAMILSTQMTPDLHNVLLGYNLRSLLPHSANSIASAVNDYRVALLESGFKEEELKSTENDAKIAADLYAARFYMNETLSRGCDINVD